ncbi:MAG: DUF3365 domain-containing protein [Cyclobacteriaceae bacterium]|nr:DUF3365 domain-containing protein [Cyclobacteriaceae bacterium]
MKHFFTFLAIFSLMITGCNPSKERVSDSQMKEKAMEEGNRITMETQQLLGTTLKSTIQEQGIPEAMRYCNLNAYPLVDSIERKYSVIIKRASTRFRNPQDAPDEEELKFIEAYQDSLTAGKTPGVFVEINEKEIHFARPILLNDAVCLNCHGQAGSDIAPENYQVIKALYPDDKATGYKMGDLRGIWSVRFSKDDLIKAIDSGNESR